MVTYIFIFIVLVVLYLIFSSIKLRLKFNESIKFIDLSYTFIRLRLLFNDMTGRIYLAGIGIKKINIIEEILKDRPKKVKRAKEAKVVDKETVKKKKSSKFESINLKKIIFYLKKLYYPICKINIKYLKIKITDGFSDPYYTGQLYAIYSTASGIFPKLMSNIDFKPDFSADSIKIDGEGLVKLRIFHILLPLLQILTDKIFGMAKNPFLRIKKGTSYV